MPEQFELRDGEEILQEAYASKVTKWAIGSSGKLVLTNFRVLHTDRKKRTIKASHELSEIMLVERASRFAFILFILMAVIFFPAILLLFILKSVRITSKGTQPMRYGVGNASLWVAMIEEQRKASV